MRIEQETINEIREKNDILDVVSEYVKLEKRGRNYIGLCPFHDEKTPSFSVSEDKQICHCFGCKKGGNVFQFIQEIKDIPFVEAVKELGSRVDIHVESNEPSSSEAIVDDHIKMIEMHELMANNFHYILKHTEEGEEALAYLKSRGFTDELINDRKIGYSPNHSKFTHDFLEKNGYDAVLAFEAGLLSRNDETFDYFDRFRDRIIFPLLNFQGKTVGFSGRTYTDQTPKYLNSPETPIFQKRKMLYNIDRARKFIRQNDEVILLEGFMDVIKADQADIKQVVATMGTALSKEHIIMVKKLASNVTLLYDGDFAGNEAALNVGKILLNEGINVYVVHLPKKMDPDDYITEYGNEAFKSFVDSQKQSFVGFKAQQLYYANENNDLKHEQHLEELINDINLIRSDFLRKKVLQQVADLYKVDVNSLKNQLSPNIVQNTIDYDQYVPDFKEKKLDKVGRAEQALIKHFMNQKQLFLEYHSRINQEDFTSLNNRVIFSRLNGYYKNNDVFNISDFSSYIEDHNIMETVMYLDSLLINDDPESEEIEDYINIISPEEIKENTIEYLNEQLNKAMQSGDMALQRQYLEQIVQYNRNRM
ncbi:MULTISPECIES: DNA primase [Mammaliicoccus]|uniref:DNA primase n=1 Tax=Mammaliicoccus lentus TaxID=42858 RepID=A0ABS6GVT2_MAMLE|nr:MULTISPECIES: DNA primase [Mammaliicoccus]MBF0747934.1 DNA primase [Mammaliicoccus lentus]MBF0793450.1 DNA primase [Mammaliicoccus lentus]MBF0842379.1 DNA primase [Mammaliicoccus lentus]MBU6113229.1 DNA primase [Mammaliicoccus lentus]MBW0761645.1 DNA primase [Mammaliicoccus lentus]